jgi:hypothetical protein
MCETRRPHGTAAILLYLRRTRRLYGETLVIDLGRRLVMDKVLWRGKGGQSRSVDPKWIEHGR